MRVIGVLFAMLLVAGCATKVVSASARTVVVSGPDGATAEAQRLADGECKKHNRFARLIARPNPYSDQFVYDCVE